MPEAPLEETGSGLAPAGDGWFVVNVRDAAWSTAENSEQKPGSDCRFESQELSFPQVGAIRMAGARLADERLQYPVSELAARYGASVEEETTDFEQVSAVRAVTAGSALVLGPPPPGLADARASAPQRRE